MNEAPPSTVVSDTQLEHKKMDVLALIRKDAYHHNLRHSVLPAELGLVLPWSRWESNNKELEALKSGGDLWVMTVRPGGRLWLVACYRNAKLKISKDRPFYKVSSSGNDVPVMDITDGVGRLRFKNRKPIDTRPEIMAHSAQMMGILTPESVRILQGWALSASKADSEDIESSDTFDLSAHEGALIEELVCRRRRDKKLRETCLRRDGFTCQSCGFTSPKAELGEFSILEVHHIHPLSDTGETLSKLSDLITLCPTCHRLVHAFAVHHGKDRGLSVKFLQLHYDRRVEIFRRR